jgi:hypothetical protein
MILQLWKREPTCKFYLKMAADKRKGKSKWNSQDQSNTDLVRLQKDDKGCKAF